MPPFPSGPDDVLSSVGLHPNHHEPENDHPMPHIEPGNEIDGEFKYFPQYSFFF